jgi:hypothetical protein
MYHLHLQGSYDSRIPQLCYRGITVNQSYTVKQLWNPTILRNPEDANTFFETLVWTRATWYKVPEDRNFKFNWVAFNCIGRNRMFCHCTITPDHTSIRKPRARSQNLGGQHCHTLLTASDYPLFAKLKESSCGTRFEDLDVLIVALTVAQTCWSSLTGPSSKVA